MTQLPPPGWYADPAEPERTRYWDGEGWADDGHAQAATQAAMQTRAQPQASPAGPGAIVGPDTRPGGGGLLLPPEPPQPYGQPAGPRRPLTGAPAAMIRLGGQEVRLAAWWQRVLARIIDLLVVSALTVLVCLPWLLPYLRTAYRNAEQAANPGGRPQFVPLGTRDALLVSLVSALLYFGYDLFQHGLWGRTLGKRALGLRVTRSDGSRLSWRRVAVRSGLWTLVPAIPTFGLLLQLMDGLWALWDKPWRQSIHDKVAGTVVVQR